MWQWLRNTKLASAVGFCILILLIWFVGPFAGLPGRDARLAWMFAVMLVWVLTLMVGRLVADRASGVLEKVLRHQADDAVMGASPDKRAEVARLRQRLLAAIDTVKTSNLGKSRGKAALYELPWYMIIGHPAAGKSSAILHSGLTFPFGDRQAVQGVGGTRDCDWFFSTEGVLLDTAGRYSTQREDRPEWLGFLKLLKKYRPKAPVNGILVAISFPELVQFRTEQFALYARQVRERINEIDNAFGIKTPVYLVFTKIDLLGGFAHFFEDMTEEERHRVWGATLSSDQGGEFDAKRVVVQQFDELYRGLAQIGTERLANNRGGAIRPALFAFPIEFNAMREPIGKFVELLFQDDPYHGKPLLRGFYFTSALQEGTPRIEAGSRVSNQFDLARAGFDVTQLPTSNGFFLRSLFREVLFPDQYLVTRQVKPGSARLRTVGIVAGLAVLAMFAGAITWSYVGNQKLIAATTEEFEVARKLAKSEKLVDRLKGLQVLQLRLEQLYRYRQQGHPLELGMSLYHGDVLEQSLRAEYFTGVKSVMLDPVRLSLERTLASISATAQPQESVPAPAQPALTTPAAPIARKPRRAPAAHPGGGLPVIPINYRRPQPDPMTYVPAVFHLPAKPDMLRVAFDSTHAIAEASRAEISRVHTAAAARTGIVAVPAGDATAATAVQKNSLLDGGYNALKTYLMLHERERMDMSHLSDQIPKYWRPWLEANRGQASQEEINRLAERVVGFYVTQLREPDLPFIENQVALVASSRDVLRGAMHRLSAKERVYNELKARANTQFAPMTVGRILNNSNLDVVAGSYAVQGAFSREAWEKYFRKAIGDASRGEVKGDDWVLAATTQDDLRKDGDVERNRIELEALYKAEYAREWTKFLQGVAVQDFGSLDSAVQSLGKLADTQNSAIKLIFAKAAYETSWDNPSNISKSIESAKNSVLERTEKLILGSAASSPASATTSALGDLGTSFALLSSLVSTGTNESARAPLAAYLDTLAKLKGKMAQIAANNEPGDAARALMQATLNGSGSELADGLALVDGTLLANSAGAQKEIVRPLLVRPLIQAYAALIPPAERGINHAWQADVLSGWRTLATKYPFADSSNEASLADIAKFLKPQEGVLPKFIDKQLAGLVVRRGDTLTPRTWANLGINFSPAFLTGVARLSTAGNAVLQEGEGAKFELQPIPTPGLSEILVEVDGQVLRYRNGPQAWVGFSWPNPQAQGGETSRIQIVSFAGVSTSVANFNGRLSLMRLLSQAKVDSPGNPTAQLEWRIKPGRGGPEKTALSDSAGSSDGDADAVRLNFRMVSGANPLALSGLRRLGLPEKITN